MARYEITCITKPDRFSPVERITHVGGPVLGYVRVELVLQMMRNGDTFYVRSGGYIIPVERARFNERDYIRTQANETVLDNLLSLASC